METKIQFIPVGHQFFYNGKIYRRVTMRLVNICNMSYQAFALDEATSEVVSFFTGETVYTIQ